MMVKFNKIIIYLMIESRKLEIDYQKRIFFNYNKIHNYNLIILYNI